MTGKTTVAKLDDDWRIVKDPKKRKQIQDRLAQRARRKRLAQAKAAFGNRSEAVDGSKLIEEVTSCSQGSTALVQQSIRCPIQFAFSMGLCGNHPMVISTPSLTDQRTVPTIIELDELPADCLSLPKALYNNGNILGLRCGRVKQAKSQYTCPEIPHQLRPTNLQRTVEHPQWVDRFPFAHMRDTWIMTMDSLNEEEFLADLLGTVSFIVKHGYASYDPLGWAITKDFKQKWGHLFFPSSIDIKKRVTPLSDSRAPS